MHKEAGRKCHLVNEVHKQVRQGRGYIMSGTIHGYMTRLIGRITW